MSIGVNIAADYAKYYSLPEQQSNEDDVAFRERISGELREKGYDIEAHEAHDNTFFDADNPMISMGIVGIVAAALCDVGHSNPIDGSQQLSDDIAAGCAMMATKKITDPDVNMLAIFSAGNM